MVMPNLLTRDEISAITSMNWYWEEVAKREDTEPLGHELDAVVSQFGNRLLFILADYAKRVKEEGNEQGN